MNNALEKIISFYHSRLLVCKNILQEAESTEYGAHDFELQGLRIKFRVAKITPTKVGQFVTFWKRAVAGPIMPYDSTDSFDVLIVAAFSSTHSGQFIFSKKVLYENGLISKEGIGGKRAMRVYLPWDTPDSKQAQKTQAWQIAYFLDMNTVVTDATLKKLLFSL